MKFDWDKKKNDQNFKKHGLSFEEASKLFTGRSDFLEIFDEEHSEDEDRFIAIGTISRGLIVVVFVERDFETIRIISARKASKSETKLFNLFKEGKL